MKLNWQSPYQQQEYNRALSSVGIETKTIETSKGKIFLNKLTTNKMTAWEVDSGIIPLKMKENIYWKVNSINAYNKIVWSEDNYYTLVIEGKKDFMLKYSSANRRCIRKALSMHLKHRVVKPNTVFFQKALNLFKSRPETIEKLSIELFKNLTEALIRHEVADLHIILLNKKVCAAALVLKSNKIANVRFINSDKNSLCLRPVNLLYHSIIENYINLGYNYVDISGVVGPNDSNKKFLSITHFKRGFTNKTIEFIKV